MSRIIEELTLLKVCKQCMHDRLLVEPGEFRDFTPNDYEEGYGDDDDDGMTHVSTQKRRLRYHRSHCLGWHGLSHQWCAQRYHRQLGLGYSGWTS